MIVCVRECLCVFVRYRKMRHSGTLYSQNRKELIIIKKHSNILKVRWNNIKAIDHKELCIYNTYLCWAWATARQWHKWKNIENFIKIIQSNYIVLPGYIVSCGWPGGFDPTRTRSCLHRFSPLPRSITRYSILLESSVHIQCFCI